MAATALSRQQTMPSSINTNQSVPSSMNTVAPPGSQQPQLGMEQTMMNEYEDAPGINWKKVTFFIALIASWFTIFWFIAFRAPIPYVPMDQETLEKAANVTKVEQYNKKQFNINLLNEMNGILLAIEGKDYIYIYIESITSFAIDIAQTLLVIASAIGLIPALKSVKLRAVSLASMGGVGITFLFKATRLAIALIKMFDTVIPLLEAGKLQTRPMVLLFRILQFLVVSIVAVLLSLVAWLGMLNYASELSTQQDGHAQYPASDANTRSVVQLQSVPIAAATPSPGIYSAAI